MIKAMLTTTDNPFDPFEDWENWFAFDQRKNNLVHQFFNADSCQVLAKYSSNVSNLPSVYSEELNELQIDNIVETFKDLNVFKKVTKKI